MGAGQVHCMVRLIALPKKGNNDAAGGHNDITYRSY